MKSRTLKKDRTRKQNKLSTHKQAGGFSLRNLFGQGDDIKDIINSVLNKDIIVHLPNTHAINSKSKIEEYRLSIDAFTLINIILHHEEFLRSKHIQQIIRKNTEHNKKLDNLSDKVSNGSNYLSGIRISRKALRNSNLKEMNILYNYILECNDKLVNRYTNWMDVIMGFEVFDNQFELESNKLLEERGLFVKLEPLKDSIKMLRKDAFFKESMRRKLFECSSKPRSFFDHITSNVSWNSNKKCISCPNKSCALYVNDHYYDFLINGDERVPAEHKLMILTICEARACVLSKMISLESIRIQEKNVGKVIRLLKKIYLHDKAHNNLSIIESPFIMNDIGDNDENDLLQSKSLLLEEIDEQHDKELYKRKKTGTKNKTIKKKTNKVNDSIKNMNKKGGYDPQNNVNISSASQDDMQKYNLDENPVGISSYPNNESPNEDLQGISNTYSDDESVNTSQLDDDKNKLLDDNIHKEAPHMGVPQMSEPHMGEPHMGEPHMDEPHMDKSHMGEPHMDKSHMGEPHMDKSQMGEPQSDIKKNDISFDNLSDGESDSDNISSSIMGKEEETEFDLSDDKTSSNIYGQNPPTDAEDKSDKTSEFNFDIDSITDDKTDNKEGDELDKLVEETLSPSEGEILIQELKDIKGEDNLEFFRDKLNNNPELYDTCDLEELCQGCFGFSLSELAANVEKVLELTNFVMKGGFLKSKDSSVSKSSKTMKSQKVNLKALHTICVILFHYDFNESDIISFNTRGLKEIIKYMLLFEYGPSCTYKSLCSRFLKILDEIVEDPHLSEWLIFSRLSYKILFMHNEEKIRLSPRIYDKLTILTDNYEKPSLKKNNKNLMKDTLGKNIQCDAVNSKMKQLSNKDDKKSRQFTAQELMWALDCFSSSAKAFADKDKSMPSLFEELSEGETSPEEDNVSEVTI